jgi:large subunit ribosomal protein L24
MYSFSLLKAKPNKKPQVPFQKWTILRGDVVKVIAGKDKNKVGKVTRVWRKKNQITVRGVNIKIKRVSSFLYLL